MGGLSQLVTRVRSPAAPRRPDDADRDVLVACALVCTALLRPRARRPWLAECARQLPTHATSSPALGHRQRCLHPRRLVAGDVTEQRVAPWREVHGACLGVAA